MIRFGAGVIVGALATAAVGFLVLLVDNAVDLAYGGRPR